MNRAVRWALSGGLALWAASAFALSADSQVDIQADSKPFLSDHATGWFWYREPPPPVKPDVKDKPPLAAGAPAEKPAEVREFERFKARMEEARTIALFNPTPQNVERYVQYQTALVRLSSQFADAFQRVVWANPQYDFTLERPVNETGLDAYKQEQSDLNRQTLDRLAKTSVLYFFFKSNCPYCHAFAPILLGFAKATGIEVYPVSLDGGGLPEYPNPHRDRGQAAALGAAQVPAVFLANPATREVAPVAFGAVSEMELVNRLVTIANPGASGYVDAATPIKSLDDGVEP
jgi:conjugal transfer pilus assembly protein TraF